MADNDLAIQLNGQPRAVTAGATVAELVAEMVPDPRLVAVERNGTIVPRTTYAATPLAAGDRIEIVGFVQGGA